MEQLSTQLQEAKGKLETLKTSLKGMPPVVQVTKVVELKALQQRVAKSRDHHQRHTSQLDEFQYVGAQLLVKAVSVMQEVQEGRKDVTTKIDEHPLAR